MFPLDCRNHPMCADLATFCYQLAPFHSLFGRLPLKVHCIYENSLDVLTTVLRHAPLSNLFLIAATIATVASVVGREALDPSSCTSWPRGGPENVAKESLRETLDEKHVVVVFGVLWHDLNAPLPLTTFGSLLNSTLLRHLLPKCFLRQIVV